MLKKPYYRTKKHKTVWKKEQYDAETYFKVKKEEEEKKPFFKIEKKENNPWLYL